MPGLSAWPGSNPARPPRISPTSGAGPSPSTPCAGPSPSSRTARCALAIQPIRGDGTTACASNSKHFGEKDQNLTTQWRMRYGGRGVMIYWHVERNSLCIHSQLNLSIIFRGRIHDRGGGPSFPPRSRLIANTSTPTARARSPSRSAGSWVGAHATAESDPCAEAVQAGYWASGRLPNLRPILTKPIDWELIRQQYDQMIKYVTAIPSGTAETESILRRFVRSNIQHPTYEAFAELGRAVKTIFLCRYLHSEDLRREIDEGLDIIEQWNSANDSIFFARRGEMVRAIVARIMESACSRCICSRTAWFTSTPSCCSRCWRSRNGRENSRPGICAP